MSPRRLCLALLSRQARRERGAFSLARHPFDKMLSTVRPAAPVPPPHLVLSRPFTGRADDIVDCVCHAVSTSHSSTMDSALDAISADRLSPEQVAEVLRRLTNAGTLALAFFRWAERRPGFVHTRDGFHHLIEALGKIKQFRLVWSTVDTMKVKGLLKKDTFALIARRYVRARRPNEAIETFEKMKRFGLTADMSDFNWLVDTLAKAKQVALAHNVVGDMRKKKRFTPDVKTYTILTEGWGNEGNLEMIKEVFHDMKVAGIKPDVVAYGALIAAFCKASKCDEALKVFQRMSKAKCSPSPHIYCTLINRLGSEERLDEALHFFELSKAAGFAPELTTYNAVVGAYCHASRFDDASRVVDEMRRLGIRPSTRTYDILLHHLIKSRMVEEAHRVFQRMMMAVEQGSEPQISTYTMMVSMFCSAERVDMALKVWRQMTDRGVLPCMHMYSSVISSLCVENQLDEACRFFEDMLDKGIRPSGQLFSKLKDALADGGRHDLAAEMGLRMRGIKDKAQSGGGW